MAKKRRNIPGKTNRSTRYMKRHPEEAKIISQRDQAEKVRTIFQDFTQM